MIPFLNSIFLALALFALFASGCTGKKSSIRPKAATSSTKEAVLPPMPDSGFYNNADSAALVQMLGAAKSTLKIEIHEMSDPSVIEAIRGALGRGVKVQVVKEPKPENESCNLFETDASGTDNGVSCKNQRKLMNEIKDHGGEFVAYKKTPGFCPVSELSCVMHGKMVIADQKVALLSTGNFNTSSLCNLDVPADYQPRVCFRDYSMVLDNAEQIDLLTKVFDADLKGESYDLKNVLEVSTASKEITVSPFASEPLVQLIQSAKTSLRIQNQYMKDPTLNKAVVDAAFRGVKVEVTIASACSSGKPKDTDKTEWGKILGPLLDTGISIRAFSNQNKIRDHAGYMHANAIVVDSERAWVGSVNGSTSASTSNNREFGVIFSDKDRVRALEKIITQDFASSETWAESLECVHDEVPGPNASSTGSSVNTNPKP